MNEPATPWVYPLHLEGELDSPLSRWLWLVKWLLVIPHVIVLVFLWIAFVALTVVAFFAILFTGRYPQQIFAFVLGMNRWVFRVIAYAALMTDSYPPFRLDLGGREPEPDAAPADLTGPAPAPGLS
jgi:hypothetical protein